MNGDLAAARSASAERPLTVASDPRAHRTFRRARAQRVSDGAGAWRAADYARGSGAVFPVLRFWPGLTDRFSGDRVQREGQDFAGVATAWEREHSPVLHPPKRSKLTPVVDGPHGWIIGYVLTESAAVLTYDGGLFAPPRTLEDVFAYARGYDLDNVTKYQSRFAARILLDIDGRFVSVLGLRDVKSHRTVADWVLSSGAVLGFDTAKPRSFTATNGRVAPPEVDPSQVDRARRLLQGVLERAGATPMAAAEVDVLGYRGAVSTACARSGRGAHNGHRGVMLEAEAKVLEHVERGLSSNAQGTIYLASTRAVPRGGTTAIYDFLGRNPRLRLIVFAPSDAAPVVNTVLASLR